MSDRVDFILEVVIDHRYPEDPEVLSTATIAVMGGISAECYYADEMSNIDLSDLLPQDVKLESGICRRVFMARVEDASWEGPEGKEYDVDLILTLYKHHTYSEDEYQYFDAEAKLQLEQDNE